MKLHYHPETDSLYIELTDAPGAEAREMLAAWGAGIFDRWQGFRR